MAEATELTKKTPAAELTLYLQLFQNTFQRVKKFQLIGFGNFEVRERAARKGRNPQTGKEIKIAASKVPAFQSW